MRWVRVSGAALPAVASPAGAECLGACADRLGAAIFWVAAYLALALVLLILLARAKSRRMGLVALGLTLVVTVGVPLGSHGWMMLKRRAMEGREIVGQPPSLAGRVPLVILPEWGCAGLCESVLLGRGEAGAYVVDRTALDALDLTQPIALADLPLAFQSYIPEGNRRQSRPLSEDERLRVALDIDYVILPGPILGTFQYDQTPTALVGAVDHLLRGNPALAGQTGREVVQLAMAPVEDGKLDLAALRFDVLELWFEGKALGLPLLPDHWMTVANRRASESVVAQALCPVIAGEQDWFCVNGLQ